jgi:hypothetical protein
MNIEETPAAPNPKKNYQDMNLVQYNHIKGLHRQNPIKKTKRPIITCNPIKKVILTSIKTKKKNPSRST